MNPNNPELGENGESIVLDRQENFSVEQDEDQVITHKQTIVVEKFRYSKDNENGGNKSTNMHKRNDEPSNGSCSSSLSANIHKLENAEIQLNKLANEVSCEIQKVRDLRNCLINAKNEKDNKYFMVDNDKTWDENLTPKSSNDESANEAPNVIYSKRQAYGRPDVEPNSSIYDRAEYTDSRNCQCKPSRNVPINGNIKENRNSNRNKQSDARYLQHSNYDKRNLYENRKSDQRHEYKEKFSKSQNSNKNSKSNGKYGKQRNSHKRYSRDSTYPYDVSKCNSMETTSAKAAESIEANNEKTKKKQTTERNSLKDEEFKDNQRPSISEYKKNGSSSGFKNANTCDCKCGPNICRIVTPCVEYNCYCNKYKYEYPLPTVQPYNNFFCTNCGCCYPGNLYEELLIDTEAINIQSFVEDPTGNEIIQHNEVSKNISDDSNNSDQDYSNEELSGASIKQLPYSKGIPQEALHEINDRNDSNQYRNEINNCCCCCHCCCCNNFRKDEQKITKNKQKKINSSDVQSIAVKNPSKLTETKSTSKEKRNRRKSELTSPVKKSPRNSINRRNSFHREQKAKKITKNNNNTSPKRDEPSSSIKKKVLRSRENSFAANEKNENNENKIIAKKKETQKYKLKKNEKFIEDKKLMSNNTEDLQRSKDEYQKIEQMRSYCECCCCCCQKIRDAENRNLNPVSKQQKLIPQSQSEDDTDSESNNDIITNYESIPETAPRSRKKIKERGKEEYISEAKSNSNSSNVAQNKRDYQSSEEECQSKCSSTSLESLENEDVKYLANHLRNICCNCNSNKEEKIRNFDSANKKVTEPNGSQQKYEESTKITTNTNKPDVNIAPINQKSADRNFERTNNNLTTYSNSKRESFGGAQQIGSIPYQKFRNKESNTDPATAYRNDQLVHVCCPCCNCCYANKKQNVRSDDNQNQNFHRSKGGNEFRKKNSLDETDTVYTNSTKYNGDSYSGRNNKKYNLGKGNEAKIADDISRQKQFSIKKYKLKNEKTLLKHPKTSVESKNNKSYIRDSSFDSDFLLESLNTFKKMRCKPYKN